jgi:hypothetical protein
MGQPYARGSLGSWQGEDVFIARGLPGTIIASERFKEFCSARAVKNVLLVDALEFPFDSYLWEKRRTS